jgi:hypothetical protein
VKFFHKPLYRFIVWAAILIAVAAVTAVAGLAWWLIVGILFAVWLVETGVERMLEARSLRTEAVVDKAEPLPDPVPEPVAPLPPPEPVVLTPAVEPVTVTSPRRRRFLPSPPAAASSQTPLPVAPPAPQGERQWSIWALDKVARETPDAELRYLVLSLQEYADADGLLPLQFDPLVRESFGELLGIAAV